MLLELKDIRMSYTGGRQETLPLLNGVDMSVPEGKVTALIGGNGTGKTTLFNIISGFEKDYRGDVLYMGRSIARLPASRIARLGIGRLFQGRQLMENLTLMENLVIASSDHASERPLVSLVPEKWIPRGEAEKEARARELLVRFFGEENKYLLKLDDKALALSYGEQRLMALVRLLMGNYRLLLLDEPTSGINPSLFGVFREVIREMVSREGKTVMLIEHNMGFVREVADGCRYLAGGKIIKGGSVQDVLDDPEIRKEYMGL